MSLENSNLPQRPASAPAHQFQHAPPAPVAAATAAGGSLLGGWAGHERRQLLYYMQLPLADKLRWLEDAAETARELAAARAGGGTRGLG